MSEQLRLLLASVFAVTMLHSGAVLAGDRGLFGDRERATIVDFFERNGIPGGYDEPQGKGKKQKPLPKGLQKKLERGGSLPPGWQRKVARGEVLDADLYRRSEPLPRDLMRLLPPQPVGYELRRIENRIVRVARATLEIIDALDL